MSTKTKSKKKELALVDVDPRVRMKEVRALVAKTVKNGGRVDQLGLTGDDIARSQIALQDLLDDKNQRHKAATDHIANLKDAFENYEEFMTYMSNHMTENLLRDTQRISELSVRNRELQAAAEELIDQNAELLVQRDSALNTIKTMMVG